MYKGRSLWVQLYERDPEKRSNTAVNLNISISAGKYNEKSMIYVYIILSNMPNRHLLYKSNVKTLLIAFMCYLNSNKRSSL